MVLKLTYETLENLFLNNFSELKTGNTAYLEDCSWWEDVNKGLQKKDLLFTLDSNNKELYKATIYRTEIKNKWYMQSIIENKLVKCNLVSDDFKKSLNNMIINNNNLYVLTTTK